MKKIILSMLCTVVFSIVYSQETMEWETLHDITVNSTPEGYVFETVDTLRTSYARTTYKTGEVASIEFKTDAQDVSGITFLYKNGDNYEKAFYIYQRRQYYFIGTPYGKEVHTQTSIKWLNDGDVLKISKDYNNIYFHHNGEVLKTIEIADEHKGKEFQGNISITGAFDNQDYRLENVVFKGFVEPDKEPFEVKVVDPFYRYDKRESFLKSESGDPIIVTENLIDEEGNRYTGNTDLTSVKSATDNGTFFYHIGVNGDESFFDDAESDIDHVFLENEFATVAVLIKNNTENSKSFAINGILPAKENTIEYRRLGLIPSYNRDTRIPLNSKYNAIVEDPLFKLEQESSGKSIIKVYPQEIVKLIISFKTESNDTNSVYTIEVEDLETNEKLNKELSIKLIDKNIPDDSKGNFILYIGGGYTNYRNDLDKKIFYEPGFNTSLEANLSYSMPNSKSHLDIRRGLIFNADGSVNRELSNLDDPAPGYQGSGYACPASQKHVNCQKLYRFWTHWRHNYFINNFESGERTVFYWDPRAARFPIGNTGTFIELYTKEHAIAYSNMCLEFYNFLKDDYDSRGDFSKDNIGFMPFDEAYASMMTDYPEYTLWLYEEMKKRGLRTMDTQGNYKITDYVKGKSFTKPMDHFKEAVPYLSSLNISRLTLNHLLTHFSDEFIQVKEDTGIDITIYGNESQERTSVSYLFSDRALSVGALFKRNSIYQNGTDESLVKAVGYWKGDSNVDKNPPGLIASGNNFDYRVKAGQENITNHWNPVWKNTNGEEEYHISSIRFYAQSASITDAKIAEYLLNLENLPTSVYEELIEIGNHYLKVESHLMNKGVYPLYSIEMYPRPLASEVLVDNQVTDNDLNILTRQYSNRLKELYAQYYQESTETSSRKIVEEKEIPIFEEPASFTVVYPNPTEGIVNVKAEKDVKGWKIVSLSGKIIGHNQFNTPKRQFLTNIGNQSGGLYVIQIVYTDGTTESKKIMKK